MHLKTLADLTGKNKRSHDQSSMLGLQTDVLNRFTNSHRETSAPRPATHETSPMAFEKQLEGTKIVRQIPVP